VTVGRASHMRSQAEPGNEGKTGYYRSRSGATLLLSEPSLWLPTGAKDKADPVGGISFTRMALCLVTRGWASVLGDRGLPGNESNMPHMIFNMAHMIFDMNHMIFDMAHIIFDMAHMIFDMAHIIFDMAHMIFDMAHMIFNMAHIIFDMAHIIFDMAHIIYHLSQKNCQTKSNRQQEIVLRHLWSCARWYSVRESIAQKATCNG